MTLRGNKYIVNYFPSGLRKCTVGQDCKRSCPLSVQNDVQVNTFIDCITDIEKVNFLSFPSLNIFHTRNPVLVNAQDFTVPNKNKNIVTWFWIQSLDCNSFSYFDAVKVNFFW